LLLNADQIQMQNGDQYRGSVLSLSRDTLLLQNDNLGVVRLARDKIAFINFGPVQGTNFAGPIGFATNASPKSALAATNSSPEFAALLRQLGAHTNLIQQVRKQFLSEAGPEANAKFDELLAGLSSGKLDVSDLLAQARTAAEQLRTARKDLGEEGGIMLDSYLSILDHFLKTTAPLSASRTNTPTPRPSPLLEDQ
jgi:hypothetical protein